jgi:hypothetical protein
MLTTEAVALIIKSVKGVILLSSRVDLVLAEREAVKRPIALPQAPVAFPPRQEKMIDALSALLKETSGDAPDPLGGDRAVIKTLLGQADPESSDLFPYMEKYLPEQSQASILDPSGSFIEALRRSRPDWPVESEEVRIAAYYIAPGNDDRSKGYTWRITLTVVDVLAEFGAENTALFTRDEQVQNIVGSVLKRFGEADLQTAQSWEGLLKTALAATLNGVLDARDWYESGDVWIEALVDSLVLAREKVPDGENFIAGLLQGRGYPALVAGLLETAADHLAQDETDNAKIVIEGFLVRASQIVERQPDFEGFFKDHWGDLTRAAFQAAHECSPALLQDESPLLQASLGAMLEKLSKTNDKEFLSPDILTGLANSAIRAIAIKPELIEDEIHDPWLQTLLNAYIGVVADNGIRQAFSRETIESMVRVSYQTFADNPGLIIDNPGLVQELVGGVFNAVSQSSSFAPQKIAERAIMEALNAISDHPEYIDFKYPDLVAALAGKISLLVDQKSFTRIEGEEILVAVLESMSENPKLFLDVERNLCVGIVDLVAAVSKEDQTGLIAGTAMVKVAREVARSLATYGRDRINGHAAQDLFAIVNKIVLGGLEKSEAALGRKISNQQVPEIIGGLVSCWARGEIDTTDPQAQEFVAAFNALVKQMAA